MKQWIPLQKHYENTLKKTHLKDLLIDQARNQALRLITPDYYFDFSHLRIDRQALNLLFALATEQKLTNKVSQMFKGEKINFTESRSVGHVWLRSGEKPQVIDVLARIKTFTDGLRKGQIKGVTGQPIRTLISIGIGGSYLGTQFIYQALRSHKRCSECATGFKLKFLANVDPIDFSRAIQNVDLQSTIFLINSKTFTTAETMLNAQTCKSHLLECFKTKGQQNSQQIIKHHFCACSTNLSETAKFGIVKERVFEFWDWVGGRYSVCSAIGVLPLSFYFGYDIMEEFLKGCREIDHMVLNEKDLSKNLPVLQGLLAFYQITIQQYSMIAIIPYCQPLCRFTAHIQQLMMQSNGKAVNYRGERVDYQTEAVIYGEPGTNSQHSFFQELHQGREMPIEFIGYAKSQQPIKLDSMKISNHDQLMSNFFSQPDALAIGKPIEEVIGEPEVKPHKIFEGNRPSSSLMFFEELGPRNCGMLLAMYQHRTAIQGFLWQINSFDQWGVELGKQLAKRVRKACEEDKQFESNSATRALFESYLKHRK